MKEKIKKQIETILKEMYVKDPKVNLDVPMYSEMGDYSTNVALLHCKELNMKSLDLAEEIKKELESKNLPQIKQIKVAPPGFIDFFFDEEFFRESVAEALSQKEYGRNKKLAGQKIMVEYTDPNPFKEFHIGHLMSNTIGEAISRIIEAQGAEVKRACYQGDVGLHVAKAVYGLDLFLMSQGDHYKKIKKEIEEGKNIHIIFPNELFTNKVLGEAYVNGAKSYEENEHAKKQINSINEKIYKKNDKWINVVYEAGRENSLRYFESIYKKLGTNFDYKFFESETGKFGKEVVEKHTATVLSEDETKGSIGEKVVVERVDRTENKIFRKSDGAVVFDGEIYDSTLHTRVFINKEGLPTYEAKELGLSKIKYDKYHYDQSIVITGNEINEYFKVLLKAMSFVFPDLAVKTKHLSHGMLRLPTGKMSSRTGDVITAESLISQVKDLVLEKMKDPSSPEATTRRRNEILGEEKEKISEEVAIGALKYSILRQATGKDIIFDFDKSISFEGDSGPYLQYATVRANSILKKAPTGEQTVALAPENWQTTNLERFLERFSSVVERAGKEYAPQYIVTYLIELAGEFNSFYASHKIMDSTDPTSPYRLALTQAFVNVMTSGLNLLGIKVPDRM